MPMSQNREVKTLNDNAFRRKLPANNRFDEVAESSWFGLAFIVFRWFAFNFNIVRKSG